MNKLGRKYLLPITCLNVFFFAGEPGTWAWMIMNLLLRATFTDSVVHVDVFRENRFNFVPFPIRFFRHKTIRGN